MSLQETVDTIQSLQDTTNALLEMGEAAFAQGDKILALGLALEASNTNNRAMALIKEYGCGCDGPHAA